MKAIRYDRYGGPEVIELRDVDPPAVGDRDVLVRVRAASVNPLDFHFLRGTPYLVRSIAGLTRPKQTGLGADFAGEVAAVGREVTAFRPGDEVFGRGRGTFAEYVCLHADGVVLTKPAGLSYEQAAAVPVAGFTALQALRDKGRIQPGYAVLVNGAAGGVGTVAVQLAKAYGAEVTAVCSTRNVDLVSSLGADRVVDYTSEDFTGTGRRHDIVLDMIGNRSLRELRRVLAPKGVLVPVGSADMGNWIGPVTSIAGTALASLFMSQTVASFLARDSRDDLAVLREQLDAGKVTPVVDRTYPLADVPEAIRYLEAGHARGKVIVTI
jgi:NADPH:quinone reductase-like Zn-dependent oxidoreductase